MSELYFGDKPYVFDESPLDPKTAKQIPVEAEKVKGVIELGKRAPYRRYEQGPVACSGILPYSIACSG